MDALDKVKELNHIMTSPSFTLEEKHAYVDELSTEEMRGIFKEMMTAWVHKDEQP